MKWYIVKVIVGIVITVATSVHGTPPQPSNQGWGQAPAAPPVVQGWGQPQQSQPSQSYGPPQQSYGPPQQSYGPPQQSSGGDQGWGQPSSSGTKAGRGAGGINHEYTFALGYQGEQGSSSSSSSGGGGWGQPAPAPSGGGWGSEPETNLKKPSIGALLRAVASIPRQIKDALKESGLWILLLPLLVIIPLVLLAFRAGAFIAGMDGWSSGGGDKRTINGTWLQQEWEQLTGFLNDERVQRAAKGFMDEFIAQRIVDSVSVVAAADETNKVIKEVTKDKPSAKSRRR